MPLRKILLRLMLLSLALSAVAGALAVLTSERDVVWRVVGTGIVTALAAGFLLPLSLLLDREKSRPSGLLGMAVVVLAFLLTLGLMWGVGSIFGPGSTSAGDAMAFTLLALLFAAPPAMLFLRLVWTEQGRVAGWVGLGASTAAFVAMLVGSWLNGNFLSGSSERWWGTAAVIGLYGGLTTASAFGVGGRWRVLRLAGVAISGCGLVIGLIGVWRDVHEGSLIAVAATCAAVVLAHANLAMLCPLVGGQRWVRVITVGAVAVTAALIFASAWSKEHDNLDWEIAGRGAGAAGIIAGCGSLALLILARLNRRMDSPAAPQTISRVTLVCPWCGRKQDMPLGDSNCGGCGLKFKLAVEEPRCPKCDYLLYMLKSDRCPECGTPVAGATGGSAPAQVAGTLNA